MYRQIRHQLILYRKDTGGHVENMYTMGNMSLEEKFWSVHLSLHFKHEKMETF